VEKKLLGKLLEVNSVEFFSMVLFCLKNRSVLIVGYVEQGEDLDSAYDSISAFSSRRDNQDAFFGGEEGLKEIRYHIVYIT